MRPYLYLLFDLDNTLFDFDHAEETAFSAAFSASGLVMTREIYRLYQQINESLWKQLEKGETTREQLKIQRFQLLLNHLGVNDAEQVSQIMSADYIEQLSKQRFLLPGALSVCKTLCMSYRMFIITNGIYSVSMGKFIGSDIEPYFENIFVSEKIGADKPSPFFFRQVIDTVGDCDVSRYCVIGDSLSSDIAGAAGMGIDAIWLDREGKGDTNGLPVRHILRDIRDLPAYLLTT